MRTDINNEPDRNDILGRRLASMPRPDVPSGLENGIMRKVAAKAKKRRAVNSLLWVLAGIAGGAVLLGMVYAALTFAGVEISSIFGFTERLVEGARSGIIRGSDPAIRITACGIAVALFYLALNGIIGKRERKKVLLEK